MRFIPETGNRPDWPRLVAQTVNGLLNRTKTIETGLSWKFVQTVSVTGGTMDIPLGDAGEYLVRYEALAETDNVALQALVTDDAFATVEATSYDYFYERKFMTGAEDDFHAASSSAIELMTALGNQPTEWIYGEFNVNGAADPARHLMLGHQCRYINQGGNFSISWGGGSHRAASSVNGIRLQMSSGNIANGVAHVYERA